MADPKVVGEWLGKADDDFKFAVPILKKEINFTHRFVSISIRQRKSTLKLI